VDAMLASFQFRLMVVAHSKETGSCTASGKCISKADVY
jgi:hypothetical protein